MTDFKVGDRIYYEATLVDWSNQNNNGRTGVIKSIHRDYTYQRETMADLTWDDNGRFAQCYVANLRLTRPTGASSHRGW